MSLEMRTATRRRLLEAQRVMLSPLLYRDFRSWQLDVNRCIRDLVGADHVVAFLLDESGINYFSNDTDTKPLDGLRDRFLGFDTSGYATFEPEAGHERGSLFVEKYHRARRALGSGAIHDLQDLGAAAVKKTDIYRETHVSIGLEHMMGLATPLPIGEVTTCIGFERTDARGYSEEGLSMLEMLVPAYEAGVQSWRRSSRFRSILDLLNDSVAIVGQDGKTVFESRRFVDLMRDEPEEKVIREAVAALARRLHLKRPGPCLEEWPGNRTLCEVPARTRTYVMWGSPVDPVLFGVEAVLVILDKKAPALPTETAVRQRFALTPRQAEVAVLIARGLDNNAIAEQLFISPHTARRHTERVLKKLGITSRTAVALKLIERNR